MSSEPATSSLFALKRLVLRRKVLKLVGAAFHIFDETGDVIAYSKMKAFKLKEDIRLYTGEDMQTELLSIIARQIIDFAAAYDVIDSVTGEKVGALKRRGFKSLLQDEWIIMDAVDAEVGTIKEDSMLLALLRRFLTNLIPQTFEVTAGGQQVATFKQHFNPFIHKFSLDFSADTGHVLDRRLAIAGAVLLGAIEGRQQ